MENFMSEPTVVPNNHAVMNIVLDGELAIQLQNLAQEAGISPYTLIQKILTNYAFGSIIEANKQFT